LRRSHNVNSMFPIKANHKPRRQITKVSGAYTEFDFVVEKSNHNERHNNMNSHHNIVFLFTLACIMVSSNQKVFVRAAIKSVVFIAEPQQVPTSGVTVLQTVASLSAISCGELCLQITEQICNGFVFETLQCDVSSGGKFGTCELMNFTSLSTISFQSSQNSCQRFYARSPLLSSRYHC
jgi:hypothetical protein